MPEFRMTQPGSLTEIARLYAAASKASDAGLASTLHDAARSLAMAEAEASYAAVLMAFADEATQPSS